MYLPTPTFITDDYYPIVVRFGDHPGPYVLVNVNEDGSLAAWGPALVCLKGQVVGTISV